MEAAPALLFVIPPGAITTSFEQPDFLHFDGQRYTTASYPLKAFFASSGMASPFKGVWPTHERGYYAKWAIDDNILYLTALVGSLACSDNGFDDALATVFPQSNAAVPAEWFTGLVRGRMARKRCLGAPIRVVYDHVVYFNIIKGAVVDIRYEDNGSLPDQSDEEIMKTTPAFLWPKRLRKRLA